MASHFQRCTIRQIVSEELSGPVLFHGRVIRFIPESPGLVVVGDGEFEVVVDFSNLEGPSVEKGEYYRFLGETHSQLTDGSHMSPLVRLHVPAVRSDGFDSNVYERCISAKKSFLEGFDGLIGYAIKHR